MSQNNLKPTIEKLLIVQERDRRIMRCEREIAQIPEKRKEIENEINQTRQATQTAKDDFKARQAEIKKIELETESMRQKIAKLREQQFQIKSNEEFRALNHEIAALAEEINKTEDREIGFMEQAETARRREVNAQQDVAEKEKTIQARLLGLAERQASLEKEVQQLQAERQLITKDIAEEYLRAYNKIMENKKDQALVAVENSACAGCHMHLPAHVVCDLKKETGLVACSFCGRILYLVH